LDSFRGGAKWAGVVGESAAIILSILLAFAIDAAWDGRQDRAAEREAVLALRDDFEANRAAVQDVLDWHATSNERYTLLSSLSVAELAEFPQDSINVLLGALAGPVTFDAVRGNIDALVGSGRLDLLRNRPLRAGLTTFINLVEDADENAESLWRAAEPVWDRIASHGGPWATGEIISGRGVAPFLSAPRVEDLQAVRSDERLMQAAKQFHASSFTYSGELRGILEQIDSVLIRLGSVGEQS
jgi:hypothetical protein